MFDFVRNHTRLALGFMLLLIIPSFIFFGVQGYSRFTDGTSTTVAKVDGRTITRAEWEDAHKRRLDQMRRQVPNADVAQFDTPKLRQETLESLVRDRVLAAAAEHLQLYPTVARMARLFDSDPQFAGLRGPDNKINRELLAMQGMTPEMFDQRLRQGLAVEQVLGGVTQTAPVPAASASAALDAFFQRREAQIERYEPAAYRARVTPSDADIEAYYKANPAQFKAPEQATIEYVLLDLDSVARGITISDADLRKAYDESKARYTTPEERRASHILVKADKDMPAAERAKAKAKAEALLAEVRKNPAQFADLARKNSDDPGSASRGGDLDFFGRGAMVKAFEDTVFSLKKGEISNVVETDFGYHVMTVTDVRGGDVKPLEAVRGELEAELRKSAAQKKWAETAEQFNNLVYEQSDSLQPVVDKLKLEKKSATIPRTPAPGSTGVLVSTKLLDAVFGNDAVRNKRNTDAIEVAPNQLVSARVIEHKPARTLELAEVKDRVRERVVTEQAAALARKDGQARLAALKAGNGDGPAPAAPAATLTVSRASPQGLPKQVIDALLGADASKLPTAVGVDLASQGYVVAKLTQVLPREVPPTGEPAMRQQYAQAWATAEADAYLAGLKKRYKADIKPDAVLPSDSASAPSR